MEKIEDLKIQINQFGPAQYQAEIISNEGQKFLIQFQSFGPPDPNKIIEVFKNTKGKKFWDNFVINLDNGGEIVKNDQHE